MQINPEKKAVTFCPRRKLCWLQRTRKIYNEKYICLLYKVVYMQHLDICFIRIFNDSPSRLRKAYRGIFKIPNYSSSLLISVPLLNEWICRKRKYGEILVLVFLLLTLWIFVLLNFLQTIFTPTIFLKTGWRYKVFSLLLIIKRSKLRVWKYIFANRNWRIKNNLWKNSLLLITCRKYHNTLNQDTLQKVALN